MWWNKKKSNENSSRLEKIKNDINALFGVNSNGERNINSIDAYKAATKTIGMSILEFLGGGDMITVNGNLEYKFSRKLPGWELVSELQGQLQPYVEAALEFESKIQFGLNDTTNNKGSDDYDFVNFKQSSDKQSTDDINFTVAKNTDKALGQAIISIYTNPNTIYVPENICKIYKVITTVKKAVKNKTLIIATTIIGATLMGVLTFIKISNNKKNTNNDKKDLDKEYHNDNYKDNYYDEYDEIVIVDDDPLADNIHVSVGDVVENINKKFNHNRLDVY